MVNNEFAGSPLRVLFLSSDTGGGHRASAEALGAQFQALFPGSTYTLLDIHEDTRHAPYNNIVENYKHLSAHPKQWNIVYKITNSEPVQSLVRTHMKVTTEFSIRKRISSCYPDVVISVHPLMNVAPVIACQKISSETGKHIPFFTVVTDLGSCHYTWFDKGVEKIFVASKQIRDLAKKMLVPEKKIVMSGLPIRADFSTQAERLGPCGRISMQGKIYQMQTRDQLGIVRGGLGNFDSIMDGHKVVLVMGGGEGVGSLYSIVESLYLELAQKDVMATIMVICGRNEKLKAKLQDKDWEDMLLSLHEKNAKLAGFKGKKSLPYNLFDRLHIGRNTENGEEKKDGASAYGSEPQPKVLVHPLGFVTNMAEYMVASDVLVTKAGPGTIAEAAAVGLPVMLTSFLPGQEEQNIDFVIQHEFGDYKSDSDPKAIAKTVGEWLHDPSGKILTEMSIHAKEAGSPNAAAEIVKNIGTSALRWKEICLE